MECYNSFAEVYDTFMDNVPYGKWCETICEKLKVYGVLPYNKETGSSMEKDEYQNNLDAESHTILDLGCGTGTLTEMLKDKGYEMIGVDFSMEMLQIAMEKNYNSENPSILYLCQDMRELELYGTVGAVVSVCDCVNYLLKEQDIIETFKKVNNYLFPKGIFLFDFNTVHKYRDVIGNTTIAENREACSFIWDNFYHEEEEINQYELTIFVKDTWEEDSEDLMETDDIEEEETEVPVPYLRFRETHYQRGYTLEQMKRFLHEAGMEFLEAYDVDTQKEVTETSERICVLAREQGK